MSRMQRFECSRRQSSFRSQSSKRHDRRLRLEPLEDRRMLAVITVHSLLDNTVRDGGVSLREAILAANTNADVGDALAGDAGADTIVFSSVLSGQTITLGGAELEITEALTVDATALADNVTINASNASRIFNITATSGDFRLAGLTLTGGRTTGNNTNNLDTTYSGGAVRSLTSGNLTIDQSTVSGNSTAGTYADGGGIHFSGATTPTSGAVTLTSSTVSGNSTAGEFAYGGGISSSSVVTLTIDQSTVRENSTAGDFSLGGGIHSFGAVTLTSSTVSGNSTAGEFADGGGIRSFSAVTLTSSTVSGNSTAGEFAYGGGISSYFEAVTLTSSTVTDNHAYDSDATGGGIWKFEDTITIRNSILAGNTAGGGSPDIVPSGSVFAVDFSLLGTAVTPDDGGSGNLFNDTPLLESLTDNGGPTETHALLAGSRAIDAGNPTIVFNPADFDQRGAPFARVVGVRIDIGAIEDQPTVDSADFDTDGDIDGGDFLAWQRGFGTLAPNATKTDGDADNDGDVDDVDLGVWENQFFEGSAFAIAATSSPVTETFLAVEPRSDFQVEVAAALTSTPEESLASSLALSSFLLPDNFIVRPNDPGPGFRFATQRQVLVRAEHPSVEHIDVAFRRDWHSRPEQNFELTSDEFFRATYEHPVKATRPADSAFAELADDEGFVGPGPPL